MNKLKYSKLVACFFAATFQIGVMNAAGESEADTEAKPENSASTESKTLRFDSSWLGYEGPIEVTTSYNDDYGIIVGANFATYINARNAVALEAEIGQRMYRLNGTWGFSINERNRLKLSIERLAEKDDYDFASGSESAWVGQNAIGGTYQYIFADGWLQSFEVNAYGAQAQSVDYDDVLFYDSSGNAKVNKRRITGGLSRGISAGITTKPRENILWEFALHYDAVTYDMQYDDDDPSTSGFGISTDVQHIFTERLKGEYGIEVLSTDRTYSAGLTWLAPTEVGSRLEVSVLGRYLSSQTTGDSNMQLGVQAAYGWDDGPSGDVPRYTGFGELGIEDLKSWTRDPAVRMPEVMAVVDEAVVDAAPALTGSGLRDLDLPEKTKVSENLTYAFSSPDASTLTYSATNLPPGLTLSSAGMLTGTTPDLLEDDDYEVTVTASNRWGYHAKDTFILNILVNYAAPVVLADGPVSASFEESVAGQIDMSQYFSDPNSSSEGADQQQSKRSYKSAKTAMTYALVSKPAGWSSPLKMRDNGVLYGVTPRYNEDGINQYSIQVEATNFVDGDPKGSSIATFNVEIVDNFSNTLAQGNIPIELVNEYESSDVDFTKYFINQETEDGSGLKFSEVGDGLSGSGFKVTPNGKLVGTASHATEIEEFKTVIRATNGLTLDGKERFAVQPFSLKIEPLSGGIEFTTPEPQFQVELTTLTEENSINLNDYFEHSQNEVLDFSENNVADLGDGVTINENGFIVGALADVASNSIFPITVTAIDAADPNVTPQSVTFDYTVFAQVSSEAIPDDIRQEYDMFEMDVNESGNGVFMPSVDGELEYTLSGNIPANWAIDQNTGKLSGQVPAFNSSDSNGNRYEMTIAAKNSAAADEGFALETTQNFVLIVSNDMVDTKITVDSSNVTEPYTAAGPGKATYTGPESVEAYLSLNDVFQYGDEDQPDEPMVFSDANSENKLADIGLRIDPSSGSIEGVLSVDENLANYEVTITANDEDEPVVTPAELTLTYNVNADVTSEPIPDQEAYEGLGTFSNRVYRMDVNDEGSGNFQPNVSDDPNLSYSVTVVPTLSGWAIDEDGVITGPMPDYNANGNQDSNKYTVTVKAQNINDATLNETQTYMLTVLPYYITQAAPADFTYNYMEIVSQDLQQNITYYGDKSKLVFSVDNTVSNQLDAMNLSLSSDGKLTTKNANGVQNPGASVDGVVTVTDNDSGSTFSLPLSVAAENTTGASLVINTVSPQDDVEGVTYAAGSENEINLNEVFEYTGPGTLSFSELTTDDANLSDIGLRIEDGYIVGTTQVDENFDGTITIKATDGIDESLGGVSESTNISFTVYDQPTSLAEVSLKADEVTTVNLDLNSAENGNFLPADDQLEYELVSSSELVERGVVYNLDQTSGILTIEVPAYYEAYASSGAAFDNQYSFTIKAWNKANRNLATETSYVLTSELTGSIQLSSAYSDISTSPGLVFTEGEEGSVVIDDRYWSYSGPGGATALTFEGIKESITDLSSDGKACAQSEVSLSSTKLLDFHIAKLINGNNSDCKGEFNFTVQANQGEYIKTTLPNAVIQYYIDD